VLPLLSLIFFWLYPFMGLNAECMLKVYFDTLECWLQTSSALGVVALLFT